MNKEAPRFKLIKGGKNQPKIKFGVELFLVCGVLLFYILVIIYGV